MELYATALLYAIPVFLALVFGELIIGKIKYGNVSFFSNFDSISSSCSGLMNIIRDVLAIGVLSVVAYPFLLEKLSLINIGNNWYTYLLTVVFLDFAGYWGHRIAHEYNYFWNGHVIHHSSERYTLACALRQNFFPEISIYAIFLIPAAFMGVPVEVIAIVAPVHLFAQFWYHTELIGDLGFLERVLVTPRHHSIHHAINKQYKDKNYSQIFIIWDKLFGTFKAFDIKTKPIYGITRPPRTWNPFKIGLYHFWLMTKDAWRTKNWKDKFTIWLKPTGWRPKDVEEKFPVKRIEDINQYLQYHTNPSLLFSIWTWIQFLTILSITYFLFFQFSFVNGISEGVLTNRNGEVITRNLIIYCSFLLFYIYSLTSVMDKEKIGGLLMLATSIFGFFILFSINDGDWFNLSKIIPYADIGMILLFGLSAIGGIVFTFTPLSNGKYPELVSDF